MIEMGTKLAVFWYFTEGLPGKPTIFNYEFYRKPIPVMLAAICTAWIWAPFDIV